ncbi:MAG: DUF2589 domain-containing protein [Thermotogota bacterium]
MSDDQLVKMSGQFRGLPMDELIGGPLNAACAAQVRLAKSTEDFIRVIGFNPPSSEDEKDPYAGETRVVKFRFNRPTDRLENGQLGEERVEMDVPLLACVKIPNLNITKVDTTFDMEVKSSFSASDSSDTQGALEAGMSFGWGLLKGSVKINGSVATHKENTRSSDNSAKYHVSVHAEDNGMPEGLARVLDIMQTACIPKVKKLNAQS